MKRKFIKNPTEIRQSESAECLLACLAIIVNMHGHKYTLQSFRDVFSGYGAGANLSDLVDICNNLNIGVFAYKADTVYLQKVQFPCVLHLKYYHFVVLFGVDGDSYLISDPELGAYSISEEELLQQWSGYVAELDFTEADFSKLSEAAKVEAAPLSPPVDGLFKIKLAILNLVILIATLLATLSISRAVDNPVHVGSIWVGLFVIASLFGVILTYVKGILLARSAGMKVQNSMVGFARTLSEKPLTFHINQHKSNMLASSRAVEVQARLSNEVYDKVYLGVLTVAGLLIFGLILNLYLGFVLVLGSVLYFLIRKIYKGPMQWTNQYANVARSRALILFHTITESMMSLKFGNSSSKVIGVYHEKLDHYREATISTMVVSLRVNTLHSVVRMLEYALLTLISIVLIASNAITPGILFAFFILRYLLDVRYSAMMPVLDATLANAASARGAGSLIASPKEFSDYQRSELPTTATEVLIEAKNLQYEFKPGVKTFNLPSLAVRKSEFVVIRGTSGSGKSTLLRVLAGVLKPSSGELSFEGCPYSDAVRAAIRDKISFVSQEPDIYDGTIRDNICYFDSEPREDRIIDACKAAKLHFQIQNLPLGYNTMVMSRGASLSGGQRQRLMLARALYRRPEILILDEATSQIDIEMQDEIIQEVRERNMTVLFASHSTDVDQYATQVVDIND